MNAPAHPHAPPRRSAWQRETRQRQIAQLNAWMGATGLTLTDLARAGGVNPSTLTRFYADDAAGRTLSTSTITAVANGIGQAGAADAPLAGENGFRDGEAEPYRAPPPAAGGDDDAAEQARQGMIAAAIAGRPGVDPWTLRSRALEHEGLRPGDVLIMDGAAAPQAGDIVCAQVYDGRPHGATTVFRLFSPPYLVAAGPDERARKPLVVDNETVKIMSVMLAAIRPRRSGG